VLGCNALWREEELELGGGEPRLFKSSCGGLEVQEPSCQPQHLSHHWTLFFHSNLPGPGIIGSSMKLIFYIQMFYIFMLESLRYVSQGEIRFLWTSAGKATATLFRDETLLTSYISFSFLLQILDFCLHNVFPGVTRVQGFNNSTLNPTKYCGRS
jgi:hypothetical protein